MWVLMLVELTTAILEHLDIMTILADKDKCSGKHSDDWP